MKHIEVVKCSGKDCWLITDPKHPDHGILVDIPNFPVILDPLEYTFDEPESVIK